MESVAYPIFGGILSISVSSLPFYLNHGYGSLRADYTDFFCPG